MLRVYVHFLPENFYLVLYVFRYYLPGVRLKVLAPKKKYPTKVFNRV